MIRQLAKNSLILVFSLSIMLSGCSNTKNIIKTEISQNVLQSSETNTLSPTPYNKDIKNTADASIASVDLSKISPNECGKIMIVMFHNFVQNFTPTKGDNGEYTTTFDDFRSLLSELYKNGYRLISLNDYLNNNINIPAGYIPIIFTFDDGTSGQFNLIEENGNLIANKNSAVGILQEFNNIYPDFGTKGVFYINLDSSTFEGKGDLSQRLNYLVNKGFEIGNHTLTHINFRSVKSSDKIEEQLGANQKKVFELIPNYIMNSLSLPFGERPEKNLESFLVKGKYKDIQYENLAIMNVGADPTFPIINKKFNAFSISRVRAKGIKPVNNDLAYFLKKLSKSEQYISDGNPNTITIPKVKESEIDINKLNGKKLIAY